MKNGNKRKYKQEKSKDTLPRAGWLSMRSSLTIMAAVSVLLGLWTGYQVSRALGAREGVLWGFIYAAGIWVVYGIAFYFIRWLHRR